MGEGVLDSSPPGTPPFPAASDADWKKEGGGQKHHIWFRRQSPKQLQGAPLPAESVCNIPALGMRLRQETVF